MFPTPTCTHLFVWQNTNMTNFFTKFSCQLALILASIGPADSNNVAATPDVLGSALVLEPTISRAARISGYPPNQIWAICGPFLKYLRPKLSPFQVESDYIVVQKRNQSLEKKLFLLSYIEYYYHTCGGTNTQVRANSYLINSITTSRISQNVKIHVGTSGCTRSPRYCTTFLSTCNYT